MKEFRLIAGSHNHEGENLKPGDTVKTNSDLVERFGSNKFVEVLQRMESKPSEDDNIVDDVDDDDDDDDDDGILDEPKKGEESNPKRKITGRRKIKKKAK